MCSSLQILLLHVFYPLFKSVTFVKCLISHCISCNAERVILYKIAFLTAKKGVLDCQKACVGNGECSIYVLHCHFANPKCSFWQFGILFVNQIGCS